MPGPGPSVKRPSDVPAGVVTVTGDDSRNLMITITARQLNPGVRVVARAHEVRNIAKMRKAGTDDAISPDFTGGMRIASAMIRSNVVNFQDEMLRSEGGLRVEAGHVVMAGAEGRVELESRIAALNA